METTGRVWFCDVGGGEVCQWESVALVEELSDAQMPEAYQHFGLTF